MAEKLLEERFKEENAGEAAAPHRHFMAAI